MYHLYFNNIHDNLEVLKILLCHLGQKNFAEIVMDSDFRIFELLWWNVSNGKLNLKLFVETFDASEYCEFWVKLSKNSNDILEHYLCFGKLDSEFIEIFWSVGRVKQIEVFNFELFFPKLTFENELKERNCKILIEFLKTNKTSIGNFFEFSFNSNCMDENEISPLKLEIFTKIC